MILKGFKVKSIKKQINKLLSVRQINVTNSKIESVGVIFNLDEVDDFEKFRVLSSYLKISSNKLKIIGYSNKPKDTTNSWEACYNASDFSWNGVIKNIELQSFLDTKFDVLISFYESEIIELKLITALSKAQLKIGILQTDMRINDLIVKTNIKEFDVFKKELFKYLTILNKIKNE